MTNKPLHVVGVVGNDIQNDSRVRKVAASAAAAGMRSTIVCYTASGIQRTSRMGNVDVIRVPVQFDAQLEHNRIPQQLRPVNSAELAERHAGARARLLAERRSIEADLRSGDLTARQTYSGKTRLSLVKFSLAFRNQGFRVRRKAHSVVDRVARVAYRWRTRASRRLLTRFRDPIANIADYENALGPVLEELEPDLIHAHDFHMIGIAVNAATNLRSRGVDTRVVYDAHEWIPGLSYPQRTLRAWLRLQDRYISRVDGVIGVSPQQIELLEQRYRLENRPSLVLNAPIAGGISERVDDVRRVLATTAPIVTYHGNIQLERGLTTVIDAVPLLQEDVQVAILAPRAESLRQAILSRADELGVSSRIHILDYVADRDLATFLATADLSVVPYLRTGNNDIALPNKLFESIQAGVPVVVSNMSAMSELVDSAGIGLVFESGNAADLAERLTAGLDQRGRLSEKITPELKRRFSWAAQADELAGLYSRVLGREIEVSPLRPGDIEESAESGGVGTGRNRPHRFAVGPHNMAGQAYQLANAVQSTLGIPSVSMAIEKPKYQFPVHIQISAEQWRDPSWQDRQLDFLARGFSHVLTEAGTGLVGNRSGGFIDDQLEMLQMAGLKVAVLLHGSEIRDPRRHRDLPHSPYRVDDELTRSLEKATERLREHLSRIDIPIFVTTPDLLEDIDATWLPVTIDTNEWSGLGSLSASGLPKILHMPTSNRLKGSSFIDPVLMRMDREGLIDYIRPEGGLSSKEVPGVLSRADIVIDQIVIGAYGVMSCQAMAAGRLSVANVRDIGFLSPECPVIHADPDSFESVVRSLLDDRSSWEDRAEAGRTYVDRYHNGEAAARILEPFLSD